MIFEIQKTIDEIITTLWPEVSPLPYYPCPNRSLGDLTTEVLFSVSKLLKQSPDRFGELFLARVPPVLKNYISVERGFINVKLNVSEDILNSFYPLPNLSKATSIAFVEDSNGAPGTKARMIAGASMHLHLCSKCDQEVTFTEFKSYKEAKQSIISSGGFLWIAPGGIKSDKLNHELGDLRNAGVQLVMPDPIWCFDIDPPGRDLSPAMLSEDKFRYYLSSALAGSDIDWSTPFLNERANVWSDIQTTKERLNRFVFSGNSDRPISENICALAKERYLLEAVQGRTVQTGFVWEYISFIQGMLFKINCLLNDPKMRHMIEGQDLSPFEAALFSTLGQVLGLM